MREKMKAIIEDRIWHDKSRRFETFQDAKRELRMSAFEIFDTFVVYHDIDSNYAAAEFLVGSHELQANLTLALCQIYWSDSSRPWLQKYETYLRDLISVPENA